MENTEQVAVTTEELRHAVTVWLRVAPRGIWARYATFMLLQFLKRSERPAKDEVQEVAAHITAKLVQAGWTVTRPPIQHVSGTSGH